MSNSNDVNISEQKAFDAALFQVVDNTFRIVDEAASQNNLDATNTIFLSTQVASQLFARNLFLADGADNRVAMRNRFIEILSETLDSACEHMDRSEREMASQIILPH